MAQLDFKPIEYLTWTRENWGTIRYDLADSSAYTASREVYLPLTQEVFSSGGYRKAYQELLDLVAQRYHLPRERVFFTYGTTLGLFLVTMALLDEGDEVLIEIPNYEPMYRAARLHTANVRTLEREFENRFQINVEQLERKISSNTKAVILSNLHNPSGMATSPEKLQTIARICQDQDVYLICYEIFIEQAFGGALPSAASLGENVITISSLTRTAALKGIKLGWICAPAPVLEKIRIINEYTSVDVSYPTVLAALAVGRELDTLIGRARDQLRKNFDLLQTWVESRRDIAWVPPDGGTMALIKLLKGIDSWDLARLLQTKYETLIVPGDFFWAKGFIRVSFGVPTDIFKKGLENLSDALDGYAKG